MGKGHHFATRLLSTLCLTYFFTPPISCYETPLKVKEPAFYSSQIALKENEKAQHPYTISYQDRVFIVYPQVFSPKIFPCTYFFANHIKIRPHESFLEVGSGIGLIAVMAALKGADKVVATDINPQAVTNTLENARLHQVSAKVFAHQGDVFDGLPKGEKFDTIWWNVPFMHIDKEELSLLEQALYDPNYRSLTRYLAEAKEWLKPEGRLLIGFSTTHGHMEVLESLAKEYGWSLKLIAEKESTIAQPNKSKGISLISIQLFEAVPVKDKQ